MKRLSAAVSRAALVSLSPSSHLHLRQRGKRVDRPAFPIRWRGHRGRGNEGDARKRVGSDRAGVVISAAVAAPTTAPARPPGPHDFAGLQHGVGGPGKGAGLGGALQAMREGQGVDAVSGKAMAPGENTHTPSLAPPPCFSPPHRSRCCRRPWSAGGRTPAFWRRAASGPWGGQTWCCVRVWSVVDGGRRNAPAPKKSDE